MNKAIMAFSQPNTQSSEAKCSLCWSYEPEDPLILNCGHLICRKCMLQRLDSNIITCHQCGSRQEIGKGLGRADSLSPLYHLMYNQLTITPTTSCNKTFTTSIANVHPPALSIDTNRGHRSDLCQSCDERLVANAFCVQCKEYLCTNCTLAHQRVSLTKEHHIFNLDITHDVSGSSTTLRLCTKHPSKELQFCCQTCMEAICRECVEHRTHCLVRLHEAVRDIKQHVPIAIRDLGQKSDAVDTAISQVDKMMQEKDNKVNQMKATIHSCILTNISQLQELEQEYTNEVEMISKAKQRILAEQREGLLETKGMLVTAQSIATINLSAYSSRDTIDLIEMNRHLIAKLASIQERMALAEQVHDDDNISFTHQNEALKKAMSQYGTVTSGACPLYTTASGNGITCAIVGRLAQLYVTVRNYSNQKLHHSSEKLDMHILDPNKKLLQFELISSTHGVHQFTYQPKIIGTHGISIKIRGRHIYGSPFSVTVRNRRNYYNIGPSHLIVGASGETDGKLCRPWGICTDSKGHVIVADRSNHRVQIFKPDGSFLAKFGGSGSGPGQFNKPAGVTLNSFNHIIVTDKDNHRVQVFTFEGTFIRSFGQMGSMDGQLHYPWDVACNHEDCVLVSDTRNHRIQLFSPIGQFLNKFDFHVPHSRAQPSQPRGICFTETGDIFVTDFDRHCLVLIRANFQRFRVMGSEGCGNGQFCRPQGVTIDVEGNILVSEGRNHRVQIFKPDGTFLTKFGIQGCGPDQMDSPQGVCVTPDGYIVVVDFSNNRILFF